MRPDELEERVAELLRVDVPELLRTLVELVRVALALRLDDETVLGLVEAPERVVEDCRLLVVAAELRVLLLVRALLLLFVRALLLDVRVVVPEADVRVLVVLPAVTVVLVRPLVVVLFADVLVLTGVRVPFPDTRCASTTRRLVAPLLRTENELFG